MDLRTRPLARIQGLSMLLWLCACGSDGDPVAVDMGSDVDMGSAVDAAADMGSDVDAAQPRSLNVTGADLDLCMTDWPQVGRYRITNLLGDVDASLAVAESPTGGAFPPGTLIQLIPSEAMLKREAGFDPATNDWEFFVLEVAREGTEIVTRTTDGVNSTGGSCFGCHSLAEPQWDFVCGGQDHGCDPLTLNVTDPLIDIIQRGDLRCR